MKRQMSTREVAKKQKQRRRSLDNTQGTLDGFVEKRAPASQADAEEDTEDGQHNRESVTK